MRNKFSELVAQGVASFDYTSILPESSIDDPICKDYNNIFGPATNTHMSMLEEGNRIITGRFVASKDWDYFTNCSQWRGVDFKDNGYWTVNEFLSRFNLCGKKDIVNGDIVWMISDISAEIANENLIEEAMQVVYVVNKKTNKSYLVAAKTEEEAIKMAPESDKDDLKASAVKGLSIKGISSSIIFKDSDMVINGK